VVGLDATGATTITRTDHGLLNLHTNLQDFHDHVKNVDLYLTDSWKINDQLRIDAGFRQSNVTKKGLVAGTKTVNLGDAATIADDSVSVFSGIYTPYTFSAHEKAWSIGANYQLRPRLALFVRAGDSFRITPEFAQWFKCCTPVENNIRMYEGGLKFAGEQFSAFLTLFYNNFPDLSFNEVVTVNGTQVTQTAKASAESKGIEGEVVWRPSSSLDVAFSGDYQKIEYTSFSGVDPSNGPFDYSGHQIVRQPKVSFSVRPAVHFGPGNIFDVFADWHFTGKRYVDVANTIVLPSYSEIDLGVAAQLTDTLQFQLLGTNIANTVGLTEGNPRAGVINGVQEMAFQGRPVFGRHFRASLEWKF
jgi:outer membrane receptor protein involved in Fe transport